MLCLWLLQLPAWHLADTSLRRVSGTPPPSHLALYVQQNTDLCLSLLALQAALAGCFLGCLLPSAFAAAALLLCLLR